MNIETQILKSIRDVLTAEHMTALQLVNASFDESKHVFLSLKRRMKRLAKAQETQAVKMADEIISLLALNEAKREIKNQLAGLYVNASEEQEKQIEERLYPSFSKG